MNSVPWNPAAALLDDGFLTRAARGLLGDAAAAEDVAQEARFAAWSAGPADAGGLRAWLRTVARRLAGRRRVADARRARREKAAARPEALASAADVAAREELRRRVVDAVLALDPASRDVVLLRWYADLAPREAAERLGVPVETFRTRLKRAHARLRERLDAEHGGDRAAWAAPLAVCGGVDWTGGAAGGGAVAKLLGAGAVTTKGKLAAAAVVAALCGAWWASRGDGASDRGPESVRGAHDDAAAAPPAVGGAAERKEVVAASPFVEGEGPASREAAEVGPPTGALNVRLVWASDRSPAVGVSADLVAGGVPGPQVVRGALAFVSDADGRLPTFRRPAGRYGVYTDRDQSGWFDVVAGKTTTAEIEMPAGVEVVVEAVDGAGSAVADAEVWMSLGGLTCEGVSAGRTDAAGRCVLRDARPYALVAVRKRGFAPGVARQVRGAVAERKTLRFALVRGGGALSGVVVDEADRPVAGAVVRVGEYELGSVETEDGTTSDAPPATFVATDERGAFRCEALAAGRAPVRVLTRGRPAWDGAAEIPEGGEARLRVVLARGARVTGVVRNAEGAPAVRQHVHVGEYGRSGDLVSCETYTDAEGRFVCEGVPPGRTVLRAGGGRAGAATLPLELAEGEERSLEVRLSHATRVHGVALAADGSPAKGLFVKARRKGADGREKHLVELSLGAPADGAFCFHVDGVEPVVLILHTGDDAPLDRVENVLPGGPPTTLRVSDHAKPSARFVGRVLDAQGAPIASARVVFLDPVRRGGPVVEPDPATGRFQSPLLVPGSYAIRVEADGRPSLELGLRTLARAETQDLGDLRFEIPGSLAVVVTDESGKELPSASATVIGPGGARIWTARREGALRAELPPGSYRLLANPSDGVHAAVLRDFEAKSGLPTTLAVACPAGTPYIVAAAAADGKTIATETTIVVSTAEGVELVTFLTGGSPVSLPLRPGRYRATASIADGRRGEVAFEVVAAETPGPPPTATVVVK
jgi:RNA polymerase sigma-70 factor (ECF subfamily)